MKKTLIICFLLALTVFTCKKDKLVINNAGYAIGVIDFYQHATKYAAYFGFGYYINGKQYSGDYSDGTNGWSVPQSGNYNSGDKYMVQYDVNNPKTCRFLFDYPVTTPSDSVNYVNQFKTHPPSCCLVYTCRGILNY